MGLFCQVSGLKLFLCLGLLGFRVVRVEGSKGVAFLGFRVIRVLQGLGLGVAAGLNLICKI